MRDYARFDRFLNALVTDVYPESPTEPAISITRVVIDGLVRDGLIAAHTRVLDVGCGQGIALEIFRRAGITAAGVTLGSDFEICRAAGYDVYAMDQNFLAFDDGSFDFLFCRHVLEHSVAPLFTLTESRRLLTPAGHAYVEVPAPDTSAHHERNLNHYSVLPPSAWAQLCERSGFRIVRTQRIDVTVECGPDTYWSFLLALAA